MFNIPTRLRDQADGQGDGAGASNAPAVAAPDVFDGGPDAVEPTGSPEPGEQTPAEGQKPVAAAPATPTAAMSPEALQTLITNSYKLAAEQNKPAPAPAKQLSDDEYYGHFGFPKVDEEAYVQLFGMKPAAPENIVALQKILRGVAEAGARIAGAYMNQKFGEERAKVEPHLSYIQQMRAQQEEEGFFKRNADLVNHRDLVQMVFTDAKARGMTFPSTAEAEKFLAQKTKEVLAKAGINLGTGGTPGSNGSQGKKPTPTNLGGQSSHGRGGQVNQTQLSALQKQSMEVFD